MSGLHNTLHLPSGPPQFSGMEEMAVSSSRAKRYSSQRQRAVPEPAPPMHLGVMEGHYYEPSKPTDDPEQPRCLLLNPTSPRLKRVLMYEM